MSFDHIFMRMKLCIFNLRILIRKNCHSIKFYQQIQPKNWQFWKIQRLKTKVLLKKILTKQKKNLKRSKVSKEVKFYKIIQVIKFKIHDQILRIWKD